MDQPMTNRVADSALGELLPTSRISLASPPRRDATSVNLSREGRAFVLARLVAGELTPEERKEAPHFH